MRFEKMRKERKICILPHMTKRVLAVILTAALSFALTACGGKNSGTGGTDSSEAVQEEASARDGTQAAAQETVAQQSGAGSTGTAAVEQDVEIPEEPFTRDDGGVSMNVFAMDTYMTLLAYGDKAEEAVRAAADEIHRLDDMLSTGNENSEISRINAAGGGEVSDVTASLITRSQELRQETGGLFEIAIYPVMKLWGFPTQEYRVPEKTEIDEALKLADASAIKVEGGTAEAAAAAQNPAEEAAAAEPAQPAVGAEAIQAAAEGAGREENTEEQASAGETSVQAMAAEEAAAESGNPAQETSGEDAPAAETPAADAVDAGEAASADQAAAPSVPNVTFGIPGLQIDLGGIAKGYTSSRVMEIFKEHGIEHGLVSLGGNVQALGTKENGKPWRVAIQNPESEMDYLGILDIEDKCVITSGGYERFFEQDGVRYHHIIDPRTGYPAQSGLLSSTIISSDGTLADGLSTSLFIMGKEEAEKYWRAHPGQFDYILEDADGTLYVTEGAADVLTTEAKTVVVK